MPYLTVGCYCDDFCRSAGDCCTNFYSLCKPNQTGKLYEYFANFATAILILLSLVISRFGDSKTPSLDLAKKAELIANSIMSEAGGESYATKEEQVAVGYASQRNPKSETSKSPTWAVYKKL